MHNEGTKFTDIEVLIAYKWNGNRALRYFFLVMPELLEVVG